MIGRRGAGPHGPVGPAHPPPAPLWHPGGSRRGIPYPFRRFVAALGSQGLGLGVWASHLPEPLPLQNEVTDTNVFLRDLRNPPAPLPLPLPYPTPTVRPRPCGSASWLNFFSAHQEHKKRHGHHPPSISIGALFLTTLLPPARVPGVGAPHEGRVPRRHPPWGRAPLLSSAPSVPPPHPPGLDV